MTYPRFKYQLQFNNDEASCMILIALLKAGWTMYGYLVEDGFKWFLMQYEH